MEDNFNRDTFYYTIIHSPQWKAWEREQQNNMTYDMAEVIECGRISQKHFQDFIKFIVSNLTPN